MKNFVASLKYYISIAIILFVISALFVDYGSFSDYVRHYYLAAKYKLGFVSEINGGNFDSAVKCRSNLSLILSAKRKVSQDKSLTHGANVSWEDIRKEFPMRNLPECPDGGTYSIMPIGYLPTCSIGSNGTDTLVDDHVIKE